jgi:hypothetical protein
VHRRAIRLLVLAAVAASLAVVAPAPAQSGGADCSLAAADAALIAAGHPVEPNATHAAGQVACGAFLGPGSQGMAATIANGTCWANVGWLVFAFRDGAWQLVPGGDTLRVLSIDVVGTDLRETVPVFLPTDTGCNPTGGNRVRTWHWDGTRLVAGPFKRAGAPAAKTSASFYSPSRNVACEMDDGVTGLRAVVYCQSRAHSHSVQLSAAGAVKICRGSRCLGDPGEHTPVLAYGHQQTVGRFRCQSAPAGVTCTVRATGKGFRIDRTTVHRIGG